MKLICEDASNIRYLEEERDGKKFLYLEGIMMQSGIQNKNGRIYPAAVMEKEVNRYITQTVNSRRAYGELGHPDGPQINLDRVSHMIESLKIEGNNVIGRAKVLDTPMGNIVKGLIEGGANLGVSSRGLGSLKPVNGIMEVQDDFKLVTAADCVADPSAPDAFVRGIMEGVEYFYGPNGSLQRVVAEKCRNTMKKKNRRQIEESKLRLFQFFLKQL